MLESSTRNLRADRRSEDMLKVQAMVVSEAMEIVKIGLILMAAVGMEEITITHQPQQHRLQLQLQRLLVHQVQVAPLQMLITLLNTRSIMAVVQILMLPMAVTQLMFSIISNTWLQLQLSSSLPRLEVVEPLLPRLRQVR